MRSRSIAVPLRLAPLALLIASTTPPLLAQASNGPASAATQTATPPAGTASAATETAPAASVTTAPAQVLTTVPAQVLTIAPAQVGPPTAPDAAAQPPMQTVEVKADYDPRKDDTASKTVVGHDEIIRFGDTRLTDVLRRLPGITYNRGIRMRGLGGGYVQLLLNGDPTPPGFTLESVVPDAIERIEIVRSATAEFSTRGIAGTINIVLKKYAGQRQRDLRVTGSSSDGHASATTSLMLADQMGSIDYALSLAASRHANGTASSGSTIISDAGRVPIDAYTTTGDGSRASSDISVSPSLTWNLPGKDTLSLQAYLDAGHIHSDDDNTSTTVLGAGPPYAHTATTWAGNSSSASLYGNWRHHVGDNGTLDLRLGASNSLSASRNLFVGDDAQRRLAIARDTGSDGHDTQANVSSKLTLPSSDSHTRMLGWEMSGSRHREGSEQRDSGPLAAMPVDQFTQLGSEITRMAAFAQDEWNVSKTWSLYLGLRWEQIVTRSHGDQIDDTSNRSAVFSPIIQNLWKWPGANSTQLRLGLTRTYTPPSLGQLVARRVVSPMNSVTMPDRTGNPNLLPALSWGLDTSLERNFASGALASLSAYARHIDNQLGSSLSEIDGRWTSMPVNDGKAQARGIEMETRLPLKRMVEHGPDLELRLNMTRNWSSVSNIPGPNNRLANQTPFSANAGLDYGSAVTPIRFGANFSFQTNGLSTTGIGQTLYGTPRRDIDLYAARKLDRSDTLRILMSNLLHQPYVFASTYVDASGQTSDSSSLANHPTVRLSWEHKFQ